MKQTITYNNRILILLLLIVFVCVCVYILMLNGKNNDTFISTKNNNGADTDDLTPEEKELYKKKIEDAKYISPDEYNKCSDSPSFVDTCVNYNACCTSKINCHCSHPINDICHNEYLKCMQDNAILDIYSTKVRKDKCINQREVCCNGLIEMTKNIEKDETRKCELVEGGRQNKDVLCKSQGAKYAKDCPMLCMTNKKCRAYSVQGGNLGCTLYSSVNLIKSPFGDESKLTKYYKCG